MARYLISRLLVYVGVIFVGISICFIIPRFTPLDPVMTLIYRFSQYGQYYDPEAVGRMIESLKELYGLKGSIWDQYITFWRRLFSFDLGPSLTYFPISVVEIINRALPWTLSLLITTTILGWLIGNLLGGIAGYFSNKRWAKVLEIIATTIYPIPYYILSLILIILLTYLFPLFPAFGTPSISPSLSIEFITSYIYHSFLPALSLILINYGWWFISMRSLITRIINEDYVVFARAAGIPDRRIMWRYVIRNSLLPQVTGLSMSLAGIFNGALITEMVFSYPGIGWVLFNAITNGDFNLMMGILVYSIVAVASAALLLDLIYPLIDPRIRYR